MHVLFFSLHNFPGIDHLDYFGKLIFFFFLNEKWFLCDHKRNISNNSLLPSLSGPQLSRHFPLFGDDVSEVQFSVCSTI